MKHVYTLLFIAITYGTTAQVPANYYTPANGLTGFALKTKLKEIIDANNDGLPTEFMHNDQGDNLDPLYQTSDIDAYFENDGTILDIYSENPTGADPYNYVYFTDECSGSFNAEGQCYNKEHTIPKSVFNDNSPMVDDAHHVVPTDGRVNGLRGSFPFGVVDNSQLISQNGISNPTQNGSKAGGNLNSGYSAGYTGTVFEPLDEFKGDIARIYFYFVTRYEDQVDNWSGYDMFDGSNNKAIADPFLNILLTWHQMDPVSQKEIDRNNVIFNYQNNRNPFVDNPQYAAQIWSTAPDTQAPTVPTNLVASNPADNTIDLSWTASTDNVGVVAYDIYVDNVNTSSTSNTTFTVTSLTPGTNYCFTIKARDASGNESAFSNQDCETTTNNGTVNNCASEDFSNIPPNNSQYTSRSWTGANGVWTAEEARTDETINGRAVLIDFRNNNDTGSLTSPMISGGIGNLTVTTQRIFSGSNGTLDVLVNNSLVGTIPYDDTMQTVGIQNINIAGDIEVVIRDNNSASARVGLDDLSWTCFSTFSTSDFDTSAFTLHPNPANDVLTITLKNPATTQIELFSLLGAKVLEQTISKTTTIGLNDLNSGVYIIRLQQGNQTVTKRLVKN